MKFTPRQIQGNVNISRTSAIREFFVLCGAILCIAIAAYFILGFALDIFADRVSRKTEKEIAGLLKNKFHFHNNRSDTQEALQKIADNLAAYIPESGYDFKVYIVPGKEANAVALPGGNILVNSALINESGSENELAMVLAHEMGHYMHRDHLRGLGRGLVLVAMSTVFFGQDNQITQFFSRALLTMDLQFSRKQEERADAFALDLLYKKYGHVAGATDFFERRIGKRRYPGLLKYFSTHPPGEERIMRLKEEIRNKGYKLREKIPLAPNIKIELPAGN